MTHLGIRFAFGILPNILRISQCATKKKQFIATHRYVMVYVESEVESFT